MTLKEALEEYNRQNLRISKGSVFEKALSGIGVGFHLLFNMLYWFDKIR